jgi:hypothetical protein
MTGPMRRVLVVIAVILTLIVTAIVTSYITWENIFGQWTASTAAEGTAARSVALSSTFAAQRPLMTRYLAALRPGTLAAVRAYQARFGRLAAGLRPRTPAGTAGLARGTAAEAAAYAAFQRATATPAAAHAAIGPVDTRSAARQSQWEGTSARLEALIAELEGTLQRGGQAAGNGGGPGSPGRPRAPAGVA